MPEAFSSRDSIRQFGFTDPVLIVPPSALEEGTVSEYNLNVEVMPVAALTEYVRLRAQPAFPRGEVNTMRTARAPNLACTWYMPAEGATAILTCDGMSKQRRVFGGPVWHASVCPPIRARMRRC